MTTYLLALFTTAIELTGHHRMMLMLPLCLSVAIVYKAMRCEDLSRLRRESLVLWATIVGGMLAVGVSLWVVFSILT